MAALLQVVPPRLPTAPTEYEKRFHDQHSDVLRLYFNQLGGNVNTLVGTRGGQYVNNPYAAIQRTTDKTFTANTATQITFDQNDYLNGCTNDGTDGIAVEQSGVYNYQFSIQFANTDSQAHAAWVWLRKNGVDIPGTGSKFDVPSSHGSSDGYLIAACNFYVDLAAEDTIEMWAAVNNAAVYMEAYAAQTSPFAMPSIPSVVATLSFVSSVLP
jgi:hypothetical protein